MRVSFLRHRPPTIPIKKHDSVYPGKKNPLDPNMIVRSMSATLATIPATRGLYLSVANTIAINEKLK